MSSVGKRKDMRYWNVPVSPALDDAVEQEVRVGLHSTKSDLIREAVREKLRSMGPLQGFRCIRRMKKGGG